MSAPNDNILATYTERLPQVCRTFRLYSDRVEIVASWTMGKKYQVTIPLSSLSDKVSHFTVKNRWFSKAIMIGSLIVGVALVFSRSGYPDFIRRVASMCWPMAGAAFVVAALSFPKRQFVRFQQRSGGPGIDLCKTGSKDRFDHFIMALRKHIMRSKKS